MFLAKKYLNENLAPHWNVNDTKESFEKLLNHISSTTNFKSFFEKEISHPELFSMPKGMIIADIGAGNGWTSALLALKPEVEKVYAIEPSKSRYDKIMHVAKHFNVPQNKIIPVMGNFEDLKIPQKIHLACLSSSFHHCFDDQVPKLFHNNYTI